MMSKEEIYNILKTTLVELFEIPAEDINNDADLYESLDIDSIDAIDLIDHIRRQTGYKLQAEDFRNLRTIGDIVDAVYAKQQDGTQDA
ncbi:acyl carrier protein [Cardiobacteriaceae bacterium TAE3-ERU3]|nr:acyl carrier protein [Cardiobacteriaceae bacterium TAE3-ERU3]